MNLASSDGNCCIANKSEDNQNHYNLMLCNGIGSPVETKTIGIQPLFVKMTKSSIIVCSKHYVYIWQ